MAERNRKAIENVPGEWYIDDCCTPCRVCIDEAPNLLELDEFETHMYFFKQPENAEEISLSKIGPIGPILIGVELCVYATATILFLAVERPFLKLRHRIAGRQRQFQSPGADCNRA